METYTEDDTEVCSVVLQPEGMFLIDVSEQTLRPAMPVSNTFDREAEIANAVDAFIHRRG